MGRCPDDFTCGAQETRTYSAAYSVTMPYCQGSGDPYVLVADLAEPEVARPLDVELVFTMQGDLWPGGGDPGQAGELILVDEDGVSRTFDMPATRDGLLELGLAKGVYEVSFNAGPVGLDDTRFPHITRTGVLEIVKAGDTEIDVPGVRVPVSISLDGTVYSTLPADTVTASLTFWSPESGFVSRSFSAANARLDNPIVLPPGVWDVTWNDYAASAASPFPTGKVEKQELTEVTARGDGAFELDLRRVAVSGTVRVDGTTVPSGCRAGFRDKDGSVSQFPVTTTGGTSRYQGWVYPGVYDVLVDTNGATTGSFPNGAWLAAAGIRPGVIDLTATTVAAAGTVTLNNANPLGGYRGSVQFVTANGSTSSMGLDSIGDASFTGRVWAGASDIWLDGDGIQLPSMPTRMKTAVQPNTNHALNVSAEKVEITLTRDGQPVGGTGYRGSVTFTAVDGSGVPRVLTGGPEGASLVSAASFANSGAAIATSWLPRDTYAVAAVTQASAELPGGQVALGTITVNGPLKRTLNAQTTRVSVEVLWDGETMPPVSAGENRGLVILGGVSAVLPPTGRSKADLWLWSTASGDVMWVCNATSDCTLPGPTFHWLWYGLRW